MASFAFWPVLQQVTGLKPVALVPVIFPDQLTPIYITNKIYFGWFKVLVQAMIGKRYLKVTKIVSRSVSYALLGEKKLLFALSSDQNLIMVESKYW